MNEQQECPLDPRMPPQREHLPNITRLACDIIEVCGMITYIGRDPRTWEVVETGNIEH